MHDEKSGLFTAASLAATPNHCVGALRQQGIALAYGLASASAPARSGVILVCFPVPQLFCLCIESKRGQKWLRFVAMRRQPARASTGLPER